MYINGVRLNSVQWFEFREGNLEDLNIYITKMRNKFMFLKCKLPLLTSYLLTLNDDIHIRYNTRHRGYIPFTEIDNLHFHKNAHDQDGILFYCIHIGIKINTSPCG